MPALGSLILLTLALLPAPGRVAPDARAAMSPTVATAIAPAPLIPLRSHRFQRAEAVRLDRATPVAVDTPVSRPPLIEYSDAYYTRQQIHKWSSWAMLPLFALQYASGHEVMENGSAAPGWARQLHQPTAAGVAALFGVNTVTGVWNLWEGRQDPYGRGWKLAHGLLMLAADAGFVATGMLAEDAGEGGSATTHRDVALASMSVAAVSWLMMLPPFRRD